jgi:hypothetical protein
MTDKTPGSRKPLWKWIVPSMASLRVAAYATVVFGGCAFWAARSVYADVKEAALSAGHELSRFDDLTHDANTILFNGAQMHHASAITPQSVGQVLDRYEQYCEEQPTFVAQAMAEIPKTFESKIATAGPRGRGLRAGVVREEKDGNGMVVCFVDDRASGIAGLAERLRRFSKTSDLSEFGHFRYVVAKRQSDGTTHVMTLWSDDHLNLKQMFPASGDVPGGDSLMVPRPASSRRTLAAGAQGMPFAVRVYDSTESKAALQKFYDDAMQSRGWATDPEVHDREGTTAYIREDGLQVFVTLGESNGRSFASVVETGRVDVSQTADVKIVE